MAKLTKYTLSKNHKKDTWELKRDSDAKKVASFHKKADATAGGVLKKAVGTEGGSVKIQKENARFQEERTFPRSKDPKSSPG